MITNIRLEIINLSKSFNRKLIFRNVNFVLQKGSCLIVTGKNGSGKSTFLKIISGLISQSSGELKLFINQKEIKKENYYQYLGYVSPYLVLYDEFSLYENLLFASKIRDIKIDFNQINNEIEKIGLLKRKDDLIKTYSSGMKQRAKYLFSMLHNPFMLCFDEPTSNLDDEGKKYVFNLINEASKDKIVIVATNEHSELDLSKNILNLDEFKNK